MLCWWYCPGYPIFKINAGGHQFERLDDGGTVTLKLGDLLSGADSPPPLGFVEKLKVEFTDDKNRLFPTASTCTCTLYLSIHTSSYGQFQSLFDEAIVSGQGFGTI